MDADTSLQPAPPVKRVARNSSLKVKDGKLTLSDKQEKYILYRYGQSYSQRESAVLAGYPEKNAHKIGYQIDRKLKSLPEEAIKSVAVTLGANPAWSIAIYKELGDKKDNDKVRLMAADRIMTLFGHGIAKGDAEVNRMNIAGHNVCVIVGEDDRRKKLTDGYAE